MITEGDDRIGADSPAVAQFPSQQHCRNGSGGTCVFEGWPTVEEASLAVDARINYNPSAAEHTSDV